MKCRGCGAALNSSDWMQIIVWHDLDNRIDLQVCHDACLTEEFMFLAYRYYQGALGQYLREKTLVEIMNKSLPAHWKAAFDLRTEMHALVEKLAKCTDAVRVEIDRQEEKKL